MNGLAATALRAFTRLLACIPLEQQRRAGCIVGSLASKLPLDAVTVTRINLTRCYPLLSFEQRDRLVRASVQETANFLMEAGVIFHWSPARWLPLAVQVDGEALISDALRDGRGVLILVPHLGNWEFLSLYLSKYRITALYDPPRLRGIEELIRRARSRAGAKLVPISRGGLKTLYRTLAEGGLVGLLPDQVPQRPAGVYADFFGQPALTMTLAHRLIARTQPVVLFGAALRVDGGFALRFLEADPAVRSRDALVATTAINGSIERLVREVPAQYQWEYKRFKRQPLGWPDWYARTSTSI